VSTHKYVLTTVLAFIVATAVTVNNYLDNKTELEMLRITGGKPVEIRRQTDRRIRIGVEFPSWSASKDAEPGKEVVPAK
jgi:hypothetical protein